MEAWESGSSIWKKKLKVSKVDNGWVLLMNRNVLQLKKKQLSEN